MNIRKIQDADVKNKKVVLRVDFNVAMEKGKVKEKFKIEACRETLEYLLEKKARVALITYLGRPGGKINPKLSLNQIKNNVGSILNCSIKFVDDCVGEKVIKTVDALEKREVALLENVRFYPEEGDIEKGAAYDPEFAKRLAYGFNLFVNEAFSQCHRDQASVTGITQFLPSFAGLRLQKEIEEMEKIKNNFERPAVAIIGGAKIETKLPVIKFFEKKYDYVLVGGKIANEALDQKMKFSERVILPTDFIDGRMDIGPETLDKFEKIISTAKTIIWNGPTGKFEEEKYSRSSKEILDAIIASSAYSVVGGGETIEVLEKYGVTSKISFVSTGGGAMLEYLGGETLPGIEALKMKKFKH